MASTKHCTIEGCNRTLAGWGYCHTHYYRYRKYGSPHIVKIERHGFTGTPVHQKWAGMKRRCTNPNDKRYHDYGGRGIKVCERWLTFTNFLEDMGEPPTPDHSLERVDVNGDYEPSNCIWIPLRDQAANKRNNRLVSYGGRTRTLAEWGRQTGINWGTIWDRLNKGWSPKKALTTPVTQKRLLTYRGETKRISAWCREFGRSTDTVSYRLSLGWSVHDALNTPPMNKGGRQ